MLCQRFKSHSLSVFAAVPNGPSHVDTFDYKPKLYELDGKTVPVKTFGRGGKKNEGHVVGPKWKFQRYRPMRQVDQRSVSACCDLR